VISSHSKFHRLEELTAPGWIDLLKFANKYTAAQLQNEAIGVLDRKFNIRHSHRLMLASWYGIAEWIRPAIMHLLSCSDSDLIREDFEHLPPSIMSIIHETRSKVRQQRCALCSAVYPLQHIMPCMGPPACGKDWEHYWRSEMMWLIHPLDQHRRTMADVRDAFGKLDDVGMLAQCLDATKLAFLNSEGAMKEDSIIQSGLQHVIEELRRGY
jgi:hypothetical protein